MTFLDEKGVGPCGHAAKHKRILINVYASCLSHQVPRKLAFSVVGCTNDKGTRNLHFSHIPNADSQNTIYSHGLHKCQVWTRVHRGRMSMLPGATWKNTYPVMDKDQMEMHTRDYCEIFNATRRAWT